MTLSASTYAQEAPDERIADIVRAGKVRVALGLGTPALALKDASTKVVRGPAVELARALASRMGVELETIEFASPGHIVGGLRTNPWDVTFIVIDPRRAGEVDFSPPYMTSEFTYLVGPTSSLRVAQDADRPGVRIAVGRGDASELRLRNILKAAKLLQADTLTAAVGMVRTGEADAFAAPRVVLFGLSAQVPGSRVLDGAFALSGYAASVPKGNAGHLAFVSDFLEQAKTSGLLTQIIEHYGLKGVEIAPAQTD
jgi:polar amino acid transport system substrate-binding protein